MGFVSCQEDSDKRDRASLSWSKEDLLPLPSFSDQERKVSPGRLAKKASYGLFQAEREEQKAAAANNFFAPYKMVVLTTTEGQQVSVAVKDLDNKLKGRIMQLKLNPENKLIKQKYSQELELSSNIVVRVDLVP